MHFSKFFTFSLRKINVFTLELRQKNTNKNKERIVFNFFFQLLIFQFFFCIFMSLSIYRYEIKYTPIKYIETTERGLVVITVNEADGGRYDCYLGGSLLCSYSITVDAHR